MNKCIVIYKDDGISVIFPAPKNQKEGENENDFLERIYQRTIETNPELANFDYEIKDISGLPDREFRDAWEGSKGKALKINAIKKQKIIDKKLVESETQKYVKNSIIEKLKSEGKISKDYKEA